MIHPQPKFKGEIRNHPLIVQKRVKGDTGNCSTWTPLAGRRMPAHRGTRCCDVRHGSQGNAADGSLGPAA
eukprot:1952966-Amphidinium_carterae.1